MEIGGYYPGAIGGLTELHAVYYNQHWGFDLSFETQVAGELSEFLGRFNPAKDFFRTAREGRRLMGAVAIDGNHPDGARLRWFIVDPSHQGQGLGRRLINEAVDFCRGAGHRQVHLWTFQGLDAARRLYEEAGFKLAQERPGDKWGASPNEQKFILEL